MTFKEFIASLTLQKVKAFASQHGFREWRTRDRKSMISFLHKDAGALDTFKRVYGT